MQHRLGFFISIMILMLWQTASFSQEEETATDSITYKESYGLRIGGDLSKLIRTLIDDDYTGFEINADYRLTKKLYLAGELGTEEKITTTDFLDATTKGSYFKAGVDYNMYQNWLDMENMIYSGFRVGVSTFSQEINSFTVFDTNNQTFGQFTSTDSEKFDGLSAIWVEFIFGIKAEVLNNLYMGLNVQLKALVSDDKPSNFENLYIPGFNRTYDSGIIGAGFGYNISYLFPIYKKDKNATPKTEIEE